jgi:hypothetical protein
MSTKEKDYRAILADDSAPPEDREHALERLVAEEATDLRSLVEPLVEHQDDGLRQWSLNYMLQTLGVREYVDTAIERLHSGLEGEPWCESSMAAYSLGYYASQHPEDQGRVCRALTNALLVANDSEIQASCYAALLRAMHVSRPVLSSFQRDRDVDWSLVRRADPSRDDLVVGVGDDDRPPSKRRE